MSNIFVGDNGTTITVNVSDDAGIVSLSSATSVAGTFTKPDGTTFEKSFTISDAAGGACTTSFTSSNVSIAGTYTFQVTVTFSDGNIFKGDIQSFKVDAAL